MRSTLPGRNKKTKKMQGKMNVELLVSLVSEHKELYLYDFDKRKYLLSSSEWQASVRSVKLRSTTLCTGVFLFYIKRHLMSGNEFACSLGSSSAKIAWVWTQQTRWKTLANNVRRYSSRCVRAFRLQVILSYARFVWDRPSRESVLFDLLSCGLLWQCVVVELNGKHFVVQDCLNVLHHSFILLLAISKIASICGPATCFRNGI